MKYIDNDADGVTTYDRYFQYLDTIQDQMPESVFLFASDFDRYILSNTKSLHDSWVESISVTKESRNIDEAPKSKVDLVLFGQMHDRFHKLSYMDVKELSFDSGLWHQHREHDLLVHEFRLEDDEVVHELEFSENCRFSVKFSRFEYRELAVISEN